MSNSNSENNELKTCLKDESNDKFKSTLEIAGSGDNMFEKLNNKQISKPNEMQKSRIRWIILMLICFNCVI